MHHWCLLKYELAIILYIELHVAAPYIGIVVGGVCNVTFLSACTYLQREFVDRIEFQLQWMADKAGECITVLSIHVHV